MKPIEIFSVLTKFSTRYQNSNIKRVRYGPIVSVLTKWRESEQTRGRTRHLYLEHGVALNRIGHILLDVLEPGVERRSFLGKRQIQVVYIAQTGLSLFERFFALLRRRFQSLPPASTSIASNTETKFI